MYHHHCLGIRRANPTKEKHVSTNDLISHRNQYKGQKAIFTLSLVAIFTLWVWQFHQIIFSFNSNQSLGRAEIEPNEPPRRIRAREDNVAKYRAAIIHANKILVFYNLFVAGTEDEERVQDIVNEQLAVLDPQLHYINASITSLGHPLPRIPDQMTREHIVEGGDEGETLHALWNYCRSNNNHDTKVVYLHSKGSFHPSEQNDKLRRFLTEGALSGECAHLPDTCNVCSSRMSPLPHPHTPGNMWLARCDYVAKLVDPFALKEKKLPKQYLHDNACHGYGRFFFEHWVHSHPSVSPCDLYAGNEYTWAYEHVPRVPFRKNLQRAPRFEFNHYVQMESSLCPLTPDAVLGRQVKDYKTIYNSVALADSWWGWNFFTRASSHPPPSNKRIITNKRRTVPRSPSASFCYSEEGSLHHIALDMIQHSSRPGSPSYEKLKHVLNLNQQFYINLGSPIFHRNEVSISTMLQGYGLNQTVGRPSSHIITTILVETKLTDSVCRISEDECRDYPRILIQIDHDKLGNEVELCHSSPNCIIVDSSIHNLATAVEKGWTHSFVLLPVMIQSVSRLESQELKLEPLQTRSHSIVYLDRIDDTPKALLWTNNTNQHPETFNLSEMRLRDMTNLYRNTKVCVVSRRYYTSSVGGGYKHLSELARFGCIPVFETFSDSIGTSSFEHCGRVIFSNEEELLKRATDVVGVINHGLINDFTHVDWWKKGVNWGQLLLHFIV
jgi:hypothetical protein